jgi:chromosomal replication initiator protein
MNPYIIPGIPGIDVMCANEWGIPRERLYHRTRKREVVEARQMAMYLHVTRERSSYATAAGHYGLDHATAIHAVKTVRALMAVDKEFKRKANGVIDKLQVLDNAVEYENNS